MPSIQYDDYLDWLKTNSYIIRLRGREYVTHKGLLGLATKYGGLRDIETELIGFDMGEGWAIVKATASGERGRYSGIGDGTPKNLKKVVSSAFVRMAETRAINRALRAYLAVGMTSLEELPDLDEEDQDTVEQKQDDRFAALNKACGQDHDVPDVLALMKKLKGDSFDINSISDGDFKALLLFITKGTINQNKAYLEIKEKGNN